MVQYSRGLRQEGRTIVFVPTMGFLHQGHLTLMKEGRSHGSDLIVSIFVNPAQFGPNEDLDTYPRDLEQDLDLCRQMGVSAVFTPTAQAFYPEGFQTWVELTHLPQHLCGLSRPVFFRGVTTVVSKLFNIIRPDVAVFGEKDFQQLTIIRQMVKDLCMGVEIVGVPIVREADGLAMSSRNKYLTAEQRPKALLLSQSLNRAEEMVSAGETAVKPVVNEVRQMIATCPDLDIDYVSVCDIRTLEEVAQIKGPVVIAMAVRIGKTRLIDNRVLYG